MTDVFRAVRERVSAQEAARHYGLTFDRRGWALCPFHRDKHPSMSFRNGRFRCWVCDLSGDSIDLTGRLLGLDAMGAVRRLNADFGLALPLDRQPTQAEKDAARRRAALAEAHRAFEVWRQGFILQLSAACREAHLALQRGGELTEREAEAVKLQAVFEHYSDVLANGTPEEQAQIYREREVIGRWIGKVLNG